MVVASLAAPASAETLADAVAIAYAHNPTLVRQRYIQKATDENYVQARGQYGPQLSIQASSSYSRTEAPNFFGQQVSEPSDAGSAVASLNQPLYTAGRLRGQLLSARAGVQAGQETLRSVEQQVVRNVVIVYAQVVRDMGIVQIGRQNVAVLQEQLRENRARYTAGGDGVGSGDVTLTDVGQSDARLAAAQIQLASSESQLAISRGQYLQIVGQNPGTLDPLPDLPGLPKSIDEAFVNAERNNPDLLAAKYTEQASSAAAAAVRGSLGPTIALSAEARYQNNAFAIDRATARKGVTAGVTVSQPVFTSGILRSRVRQADAQNSADQAELDDSRRTAIQNVTASWSSLAAARIALGSGERQVTSAQLAYAGMHREELNGLRSTIDTLNAEQELVNAQITLLQNRFTEYVARASLLAAVGDLRAEAIVSDLKTYSAEANFRAVRNRGWTPLEPVAEALDQIGSANPRRPLAADLTGADSPLPNASPALPPTPTRGETDGRLVPVTESRLVPASSLPGGLPPAPDLPARPPLRPEDRP